MTSQEVDCMFYHHICHVCKISPSEPADKFKKCSNCKLFTYCTVEHQKSDWKRHKPFCRAVKDILGRIQSPSLYNNDGDCMDEDTLYRYQCSLVKLAEINLKRSLTGAERFSILFADICGLCYRPNDGRVPCLNCHVEHYCSEDHREEHAPVHADDCASLSLAFALDLCATVTQGDPVGLDIDCDSTDVKPFPAHMTEFLDNFTSKRLSEYDRLVISDLLSYSLTLVFALNLAKCADGKNTLAVHVIGAEELEGLMIGVLDPLFHWYPHLTSLSVSLIGPKAPRSINQGDQRVVVTTYPELYYHDFARRSTYTQPDVAIVYNCGFHEFHGSGKDTWRDTLVNLTEMSSGSVLAFSSYTSAESKEDTDLVKNVDNREKLELLRSSANPFSSLKPYRNPERGGSSIFFFNNYLTVFKIKT